MKRSQLETIIRESLSEVLNELKLGTIEVGDIQKAKDLTRQGLNVRLIDPKKLSQGTTTGTMEEGELDELANQPGRYELSPEANAADFTGKKAQIIAAMQDNGESMTQLDVALALGYNSQQPIYANFNDLLRTGIIVPSTIQTARRPIVAPVVGGDEDEDEGPDELPSGYEDPEGGVAGNMSDEEVDAGFPRPMGIGGDEEEPEIDGIETGDKSSSVSASDDDFEAFMQYTDLEKRLATIKSDLNKEKRSSRMGGESGDIRGGSGINLDNLRSLKNKIQQKMDSLVASSPYLQARIAKASQPKPEELDEWTKNKLQYYAGIIK